MYVGTEKGLTPLAKGDYTLNDLGQPTSAKGYTPVKGAELFALDQQLRNLKVPTTGVSAIQPQGTSNAVELAPTLRYDPKTDMFVRLSDGKVFRDNGQGSFVADTAPGQTEKAELQPGWKTYVGFRNFSTMIHDPLVSKPFLSVFAWTFVFAASVVLLSFAVGLFLAITLDKNGLRFQRMYRSVLVIPWAIPGFLSLLVWAGLLNDDFGVVNRIFHIHVPWLFGGNVFSWLPFVTWPRIAVMLVSVWLTVPYFFLVSLGALQSIPEELTEAARVDGGGAWQIFRRVTLPLLLVAVAPLLIASFAFNFNNFNNVYLLTGGGPYTGASSIAGQHGHPDQLHVQARDRHRNGIGNYGLASAVRDHHLLPRRRRSRASRSAKTKSLENAESEPGRDHHAGCGARGGGRRRRRARRGRARSSRTPGGGTSSAASRSCISLFPVVYIVSSSFNAQNNAADRRR